MAYVSLKRNFEEDFSQTPEHKTPKRRRYSPENFSSAKIVKTSEILPSFNKTAMKLTPEQTVVNHKEKIGKNHEKCQKLRPKDNDNTNNSSTSTTTSSSEIILMGPDWKEKPVFTYEQVLLMCGNVLKERENEIRIEYDRILNANLAEQHEKFVKFIYNKIQEHYENRTPSYLS